MDIFNDISGWGADIPYVIRGSGYIFVLSVKIYINHRVIFIFGIKSNHEVSFEKGIW